MMPSGFIESSVIIVGLLTALPVKICIMNDTHVPSLICTVIN